MTKDAKPSGQANELIPFIPDDMMPTPEQLARVEEAFNLLSSKSELSTVTIRPWDARLTSAELAGESGRVVYAASDIARLREAYAGLDVEVLANNCATKIFIRDDNTGKDEA